MVVHNENNNKKQGIDLFYSDKEFLLAYTVKNITLQCAMYIIKIHKQKHNTQLCCIS